MVAHVCGAFAYQFFNSFGQATAGTVLPLFARDLGATTSVIGFVAGAFAITALAIRPFAGPAFDSFSKNDCSWLQLV
ncbi:MAG: hypothetical protein IKE43_03695 [Coriobacteriales bacterium]|nr:hypothetical protein [Coriobacteriales bacterium]